MIFQRRKTDLSTSKPLDMIMTKNTLKQVVLSKEKLIHACVQLVTTNGRPFQLLDDSGFRTIMNPIFDAIGDGRLTKLSIIIYLVLDF